MKSRKPRMKLPRNAVQRRTRSRTSSHKMKSCVKQNKPIIIENFIEMLNTVKLYHWNTHSYAQHKATDELHGRLSGHIDKFVEVLLGKKEDRIKNLNDKIPLINTKHTSTFRDQIYQYREYLINMDKCFDTTRDTDLLNIRDEILGDINQFLYLLSLR